MRHSGGTKRAFQISTDTQDGPMGKKGVHSHLTKTIDNEKATISTRQTHVRTLLHKNTGKLSWDFRLNFLKSFCGYKTRFCRSLRKVILRTCIDTTDTTTKEYTPYSVDKNLVESAPKGLQDNGDIFGKNGDDYRRAFTDRYPEDIPGLPRRRPAEFSPR